MFGFNRYALCSPEDGEAGGGAAGGEEGGEKDTSKDVVPKSQFLAALRSAERKHAGEMAALRADLEALRTAATAPKAEAVKEYTRADLNAMVEAGSISQAQADAQIEHQITARATAAAVQAATERVSQTSQAEALESQIDQYANLVPEVKTEGSQERSRVQSEYDFAVRNGQPRGLATQLMALRAVYGPIETLRKSKSGRTEHESHRETGGEGGGAGPRGGTGNLKLSAREREHYEGGIKSGLYKDWKAVEDELKFARQDIRRKHGAPV